MVREEFIWVEKYRPKTIQETILPEDMKKMFLEFVEQGNVPNMLFAGPQGCGKTTVARALLEQLGCDYIVINGSMNGNIDTLRNEIMDFASSVSFTGGRKYVILDEADYLNINSTQPALRNFMEEFSSNCGFILTCNIKSRIMVALQSRTTVVDFKFPKSSLGPLALQFLKRTKVILDAEGIEYEVPVVAEVIKKYLPDWRRVLNELQRYSSSGRIDAGILANLQEASVTALLGFVRDKDYTNVRKWVGENIDGDAGPVFRMLYDIASTKLNKASIPVLVMLLAKYQYQAAFAADPEINLAACLAEMMVECEFL